MKYLRLSFRILLFFLLVFLLTALLFGVGSLLVPSAEAGMAFFFLNSLSLLGAVLLASALMMRLGEKVPFRAIGLPRKGWAGETLRGAAMAGVIYLTGFGLMLLTGAVSIAGCSFRPGDLLTAWLLMLTVALSEEFMMRGFVLGSMLRAGVNRYLALFLSSALFSLLHLFNPDFSFLSFVNILLAGLLLGSTYIYNRCSLYYPISLHLFWNWLQGPVLGYEVSGNPLPSLLTLHRTGSDLLTGGSFGFEGSLVCTFLLLLLISLVFATTFPSSTLTSSRRGHSVLGFFLLLP